MEEVDPFKEFLGFFMLFVFLSLFWGGLKAQVAKEGNIKTFVSAPIPVVQVSQQSQIVYRRVYVNNVGGLATVYYIRN
jgi:hypothetical protein